MKPNWIIVLVSALIVMATFAIAVLGGANAAKRDAIAAEQARIADIR